ncbi:hypothetical protein Trydic_g919 [Trypoxylus dichotomus]
MCACSVKGSGGVPHTRRNRPTTAQRRFQHPYMSTALAEEKPSGRVDQKIVIHVWTTCSRLSKFLGDFTVRSPTIPAGFEFLPSGSDFT